MCRTFCIFFFFLFCTHTYAQGNFQKTYGGTGSDWGSDIQQTFDGGYVIAGYSNSYTGDGSYDGYLIKINAYGDTLWTRTYGGPGNERIYSVVQAADSGFIMTGYTASFGAGHLDVYIIKTDSTGVPLWQRTIGGGRDDYGNQVRQTKDGGYIVVGYTDSINGTAPTVNGVYIIKITAAGDTSWTKVYNSSDQNTMTNGAAICSAYDGGYVIAGTGVQKDSSTTDMFLLKVDSMGNFQWNYFIGTVNDDVAGSIEQTADSGYIIGGTANDICLIKTDTAGHIQWFKTIGNQTTEEPARAGQTREGNYFVTADIGSFFGSKNCFLGLVNPAGDTLWTKQYGKPLSLDYGMAARQTADSGFILNGWGGGVHAGGLFDMYVIKTDSLGNSDCFTSGNFIYVDTPIVSITSLPVTVGSGGVLSRPAAATGSGVTVTDVCSLPLGTKEEYEHALTVFPNPARDILTIRNADIKIQRGLANGTASCSIENTLGQQALAPFVLRHSWIDVSVLPPGVYVIRINAGGETWNAKFTRQ